MFRMFTIKYEKYEMYENTRGDGRKNMLSDNIQLLRKRCEFPYKSRVMAT